jgi:hypothetical protein
MLPPSRRSQRGMWISSRNFEDASWESWSQVLSGGRGVREAERSRPRWPLALLPEGRRLGHAPPPPLPFDQFGGIVAVDADRCVRGSLIPHPPKRMSASDGTASETASTIYGCHATHPCWAGKMGKFLRGLESRSGISGACMPAGPVDKAVSFPYLSAAADKLTWQILRFQTTSGSSAASTVTGKF